MADVVIVGLGPAGIVAARVLADAGYTVTAVQPKPAPGERAPMAAPAPTLRTHADQRAVPQRTPPAGRDGVGGSKLLAAPQAYRLDDWSFRARTATLARGGVIPQGVDLVDWPIGPDDLAPWYDLIESATGVAPRPPTSWTDRMTIAAGALGWRPRAAPAAAAKDSSFLLRGRDIEVVDATATALVQGSTGAIAGVEIVDADGSARTIACGAAVVAASVIPTVRLLLLSGLTAGGRVGRWFMAHNAFVVHGDFPGIDLGRRSAGPASAVAVAEFEGEGMGARHGVVGGSILQAAMTGPWSDDRLRDVAEGLRPEITRGRDAAAWVRTHHSSIGTVWAQPDQLPRAGNAIDLDLSHRDATGRPVARLTFALADDDVRRADVLAGHAAEWLLAAGARGTWRPPLRPQPLGTHLYGGARMGRDPATSVVDGFGRFHGVPGLVVVGSSTFPTTGGRGPVETIEALSWRAASHLADALR
ncbi:GMC oxidoreductase [Microbacterium sp. AZCO]|uniref:GMC oxidoreductase n=1 Tax=Microbacterium sp. AZCO TaxID=3142976 RepID=UPI0031F3BBDD